MTPQAAPAPDGPRRQTVRRWLLAGIGLLALGVGGLLAYSRLRKPTTTEPGPDPFPIAALSESPFLNTIPGAEYVGPGTCRACHEGNYASFRHTGMGRSMAVVDPAREPPDAAFDHPASKRRYQITRRDGRLWHRELLLADGPEEVLLSEFPVRYVVGSGRHARTYLVEADGFLTESPVTWYESRKAWDLSPGYDVPGQEGFERAIGEECLYCHAGRAEAVRPTVHRMRLPEVPIGCERCHGPASLHVARQQERQRLGGEPAGETDDTIVNPARLRRDLSEAICQQCHLSGEATVPNRGRKLTDFRPGLPLQDVFQVYVPVAEEGSMKVVGHVEQMHLSRCFQRSDTFSCLTCHNPHDEPAPAESTAYYNSVCRSCHQPETCRVKPQRRAKESPDNNCVQCHMPRTKTDVPHVAFTHHRVGIYDGPPATKPGVRTQPARLKPFLDFARASAIDRKLSLGEAYRSAALFGTDPGRGPDYQRQAFDLLCEVYDAGLRDPDLESGLTQLCYDLKARDPQALADAALAHPEIAGQSRCNALTARARLQGLRRNYAAALADLQELTGLRRRSADWVLMARLRTDQGDQAGAMAALETAVRINPRLWKVHQVLADYYGARGDAELARWHQKRAVP
jgi:predicted CXXCH cytochrome family protein